MKYNQNINVCIFSIVLQKEEKALEIVIDALISRIQDLKIAINGFILKLEHESLNW